LTLPIGLPEPSSLRAHPKNVIEKGTEAVTRLRCGLPRSPRELKATLLLLATLRSEGWQPSVQRGSSFGLGRRPIPWWTYSASHWLDLVLKRDHRVLEFGSGGSTAWLAERTAQVHSIEHDAKWDEVVRRTLPANATLLLVESRGDECSAPTDDPYTSVIDTIPGQFDVAVIDGMSRNTCTEHACKRITESGLIILDDGDRPQYGPSHRLLRELGFGRVDFFGPKPAVGHLSMTCVFSRDFDPWTRNLELPLPSGY
jgi:hypothetical protein